MIDQTVSASCDKCNAAAKNDVHPLPAQSLYYTMTARWLFPPAAAEPGREISRLQFEGVVALKIGPVRKHALSLPEAKEQPHFDYTSFRVRGKIFVTVPPDELHVHVFVAAEHRQAFMAMYPHYIRALTWGKKVVGLRISLADADPAVVKQLIGFAWRNKAPKSLQSEFADSL